MFWQNFPKKVVGVKWVGDNELTYQPRGSLARCDRNLLQKLDSPAATILGGKVHFSVDRYGQIEVAEEMKGKRGGGPLPDFTQTPPMPRTKAGGVSSTKTYDLVKFHRQPEIEPDKFFSAVSAHCVKTAISHLLANDDWCTVEQLQRSAASLGKKVYEEGWWDLPTAMHGMKATPYRLLSRRKKPYCLTQMSMLLKCARASLVVIGTDKHKSFPHAIAVDCWRDPPIFFSGSDGIVQPLTKENLANMKFPIVNIIDVAELMVVSGNYTTPTTTTTLH